MSDHGGGGSVSFSLGGGLGASDGDGWIGRRETGQIFRVASEHDTATLFDDGGDAVGVDDVFASSVGRSEHPGTHRQA